MDESPWRYRLIRCSAREHGFEHRTLDDTVLANACGLDLTSRKKALKSLFRVPTGIEAVQRRAFLKRDKRGPVPKSVRRDVTPPTEPFDR